MSSGWDGFGESGRGARWDANLNIFKFSQFAGLDVELRIVTQPFQFMTHWYYLDLVDAWLHRNDMEQLKQKYGGKLSGKNGPKKRSFECPDFDFDTRESRNEHCLLCTTYNDYAPWADRTSLVQAFWRIPTSTNPQLQKWQQELRTFSFNRAASKKLSTVIRQKGSAIDDPQHGYTILVTYTANQGANTWNVAFGEKYPLPASMNSFAQKQMINFRDLYEVGDPGQLEKQLNRIGYPKLLDPNFNPFNASASAGTSTRAPSRPSAPSAPAARPAPGRAAAPAYQAPAPAADNGFGDGFGDEQVGGYGAAVGDDMAPAGDDLPDGEFAGVFEEGGFDAGTGFEADPGVDLGDGGFGTDEFAGSFEEGGFEEPAPAPAPVRQVPRQAAPVRPAAPSPRPAAPRPTAPVQRPSAPPVRPVQRPAVPTQNYGLAQPAAPAQRPPVPGARPAAPRPGYPR